MAALEPARALCGRPLRRPGVVVARAPATAVVAAGCWRAGVPLSRSETLFCARFLPGVGSLSHMHRKGRSWASQALSQPPWPVAAGTWACRRATVPALSAAVASRCLRRSRPARPWHAVRPAPQKKIRDQAPWPAWSLLNLSWSLLDYRRFEHCPQWSLLDHQRFQHCPRWSLLSH